MENRTVSDVGGTPGGLGEFLMGFIMACVGGYLLANQVTVVGSYWSFWGANSFGITLIPMLFGVGLLFWRGRSIIGWLLTIAGALFILALRGLASPETARTGNRRGMIGMGLAILTTLAATRVVSHK